MKCNFFFKLIFCFTLVFAIPVKAEPIGNTEARIWVKDKGNLLLDAFAEDDLEKKFHTLDTLFLNYVDLDYISKFVVGKYWKQMDKEQQTTFQALFKRYALAVYKHFPLTFKNRIDYEIVNVYKSGNYTDVSTNIDLKKATDGAFENILVIFRLDKKQGNIKMIDIKIAESSLILSYRSQFYTMITDSEEDMAWFLEDFESLTQSTEESNRLKLEAFKENKQFEGQ